MKKLIFLLISFFIMISLSGCQTKQEKTEKYLNDKEFLKAYELASTIEDSELIDKVIISWQKEILETEVIDDEFKDLKFKDLKNLKIFSDNILNYMFEKEKLDNKQLELLYALFNGIKDPNSKMNIGVLKVLESYSNDEKIWIVEERNPVSYEEYFSQEHIYTDQSQITIKSNEETSYNEIVFDEYGMAVNLVYETGESKKQYVLFGNYTTHTYLASDGYWVYCISGKELLRISVEGEKEVLYTFDKDIKLHDNSTHLPYEDDFPIIDYDILLFKEIVDGTIYIHRMYLPEKKIDSFKLSLNSDEYAWLGFGNFEVFTSDDYEMKRNYNGLVGQKSSNHILYYAVNPQYLAKAKILKENLDLCYKLYKKYLYVNSEEQMKSEMAIALDNPVAYNYEVKRLKWIIASEYGIEERVNYDLNVLTGEVKIEYLKPFLPIEGFPG